MLKGYADHHVVFAIVQALCTRGMDVMTAADRGQQEAEDAELLAEALFDEWEAELDQYTSAPLRRSSERRLQETRAQYAQLIRAMKRAEAKMAPVLAAFHDQVLFLKQQPQRPSDRLPQGQPGFDRVGHRGAYPGDGGVDSRGESLHRCDERGAGISAREIEVRFHRHAHLRITLASGLLDPPVKVPSCSGLSLRMTT